MNEYTLILITVLALAVGVFVVCKLLLLYNSSDGERYRKRRMQGPFVPLSAEDIAEDDARTAAAKSRSKLR